MFIHAIIILAIASVITWVILKIFLVINRNICRSKVNSIVYELDRIHVRIKDPGTSTAEKANLSLGQGKLEGELIQAREDLASASGLIVFMRNIWKNDGETDKRAEAAIARLGEQRRALEAAQTEATTGKTGGKIVEKTNALSGKGGTE